MNSSAKTHLQWVHTRILQENEQFLTRVFGVDHSGWFVALLHNLFRLCNSTSCPLKSAKIHSRTLFIKYLCYYLLDEKENIEMRIL